MDDNMIESIFPGGLHILVVDDDTTFLDWMKTMLSSCHYKVTACNSPISALSTLLEKPEKFDLLLTDLEMPEMGGRELLKIVKKQLGIPVILMSMDPRKEVIVKGIEEGACYFLQKPISINSIRNLWTHAVWGKLSEDKKNKESCGESAKGKAPLVFDSRPCDSIIPDTSKGIRIDDGSSDKRKGEQVQRQQADDTTVAKKPRMVWTPELNKKFLEAVNEVGIDKAIPSRITEVMNVEGVDRHHVASHLQKFRIWLKEEKESLMAYESYPRRKKFGRTLEEEESLMTSPRWKKFGRTSELDTFNEQEYMGIRRQSMSMSVNNNPSSIPVLMPPAATHPPPRVNARGTGNALLGSINSSPRASSFGATDGGGVNAGTFLITNPAQDLRKENSTAPVSEFPSADNNNFKAPETNSTSACRVAGGLDSSELPMGSNLQSRTAVVEEDLENFLVEFFKEDRW